MDSLSSDNILSTANAAIHFMVSPSLCHAFSLYSKWVGDSPSLCWLSSVLAERQRASGFTLSHECGELHSGPKCTAVGLVSLHSNPCAQPHNQP